MMPEANYYFCGFCEMTWSMRSKKIKAAFLSGVILLSAILVYSYVYVSISAKNQIYQSTETIPNYNAALLLGTSKYMNNGKVNLFFAYRCNAALELWQQGYVKRIVISGDSSHPAYDEPELMKNELVKNGFPDSLMVLDKNGFNTRSSILFCKSQDIDSLVVVSQQFHNERAIVLSNSLGLKAIGYNADGVYTSYGIRVWIREWFARVKLVFID